jgi:hypothetical protein
MNKIVKITDNRFMSDILTHRSVSWLKENVGPITFEESGETPGPGCWGEEYAAWLAQYPKLAKKLMDSIGDYESQMSIKLFEGKGWLFAKTCQDYISKLTPWIMTTVIDDDVLALQYKLIHG